jgi:hypothetical protein
MTELDHGQKMAGLFAGLVMQHANMAAVFLGLAPHPEDGQLRKEMEMAKLMIDHLEMLEVKTKGNLSKQEEAMLRQSLVSLRMAFVEAAQSKPETPASPPPLEDESAKKRFTKTYE